ncbi:restriction endonuclease subunit S [Parabacteroides distasonis]|uniref:Restriction endonuclease subunit S n=1 Tax=Parabacteroides distasonis TaxID=823 RepID=A0A7K0HI75_PARDI|nr:restriction endonuclease subunit S [Parabacteroides distasonis]MRY53464.1 restriction endonuclease subunit S [Parabacteroides distasonis]MRZ49976.1 restriction endonuclease subunit S [Parabacteroides distasonis]MRZ67604.1 restriction endonuclease subunit S [Parabacteroides distasonis]MSA27318.1 restriction endonuclease subunit S [Parabacteroides distasonis]
MAENKDKKVLNVPALRFPKFSGEWKREILNDVCTFHNGRAYKQNELLSDGKYRVLRVGNFFTNDSWYYSDLELDDEKVAVNGDLLYAWSASFGPRFWTGEKVIYHYHIWKIDSFQQVSKEFLFYFLERDTEKIKNEVQGGTMVHITKGDMEKREILYPSILEQSKIARLLSLLDERIATQNKIIEDLKKLKSAISLKMLHSDSWEQFRIKDIAIIGRGRVISSVEISQQKNPTYPVYSSQTSNEGIMGYLDDYMFEGEYISWTTDGANAGTVFYRNGRFNCTNVCGLLKLKKGFDTHFVSLVLAEATKKYVSVNLANPKLMNNTMGNIQICLPKLEEQKRISIVFRRLHELLAIHNNLLTEYSKQKQYLLSQMFI